MRRTDRELSRDAALTLLNRAKYGILCLTAAETGYPCAVPINCAVVDNALIFHGAAEGEKHVALARDARATFVAVLNYEGILETFSARYESIVAKGAVEIVDDDQERLRLLRAFTAQVFDVTEDSIDGGVRAALGHTRILKMSIEQLTGKRSPKA